MGRLKKSYCLKKKGDYWYYKIPPMTSYRTTGLTSKTRAEKFVLELMAQKNKENGVITNNSKTFGEYTKDYFIWGKCPYFTRKEREGKTLTQRYCEDCWRILNNKIRDVSWFCKKNISEIRRRDVIRLLEEIGDKYSNGVVNDCISVLTIIFKECLYKEDIEYNPMSCINRLKEDYNEKVPFEYEDYLKMFPINNETEIIRLYGSFSKFICEFIQCNTGMRNNEVRCLKWENIDFENNTIEIRHSFKNQSTNVIGPPKNGKKRMTGMCDVLKQMLILYRDKYSPHTNPTDYVCCWEDGTPFGYDVTKYTHNKVLSKLKIERRGQHIWRHTFNTNLRGSEYVSDLDIRTTTGWSGEKIQDNYTHTEVISSKKVKEGQDKIWEDIRKKVG